MTSFKLLLLVRNSKKFTASNAIKKQPYKYFGPFGNPLSVWFAGLEKQWLDIRMGQKSYLTGDFFVKL